MVEDHIGYYNQLYSLPLHGRCALHDAAVSSLTCQ